MPTRHPSRPDRENSGRSRTRRTTATSERWRDESVAGDNVIDFEELRRARVQRARSLQDRELRSAQSSYAAVADGGQAGEYDAWQGRAPRSTAGSSRHDVVSEVPLGNAGPKCLPCHWGLYALALLFAIISIPLVYSASTAIALDSFKNTDFFLWRQIGFVVVGLVGLEFVSRRSVRQLRFLVWGLYGFALLGLLAIDFTPFGTSLDSGAKRWLKLGPLPPQQFSEMAKIALLGVMADFWSRTAAAGPKARLPWLWASFIALPLIGLVLIQPHLSAALLLMLLPLGIAFYAGVPMGQMAKILVPLLLLAAIAVALCRTHQMPFMKPYQQDRIASHFFSDGKDGRGANYQSLQGQRALRQGGLLGAGPGASIYKQGHLPEAHTDFILAVIGEEWGLAGMLVLLTLYGTMIFFCFQIGHGANSGFEMLLCSGVGTILAIQVICNTSVVTGLMPVTGIPLPLLSYGGSSLICTLLGLGLVLSVSRQSGNVAEALAAAPV